MRVILKNEDADRLLRLIEASPGPPEFNIQSVGGEDVTVSVNEAPAIRGKARPTPSNPGSFVIEDWDGRIVVEGEE